MNSICHYPGIVKLKINSFWCNCNLIRLNIHFFTFGKCWSDGGIIAFIGMTYSKKKE